jgi:hypothetical protein
MTTSPNADTALSTADDRSPDSDTAHPQPMTGLLTVTLSDPQKLILRKFGALATEVDSAGLSGSDVVSHKIRYARLRSCLGVSSQPRQSRLKMGTHAGVTGTTDHQGATSSLHRGVR